MNAPWLTIVVDTFNHERFIEQCVVSVLEQDFPASEMEILVVDDDSTDGTPDIVRKFSPRVRLLRKKNGGQASAYNAAFPEARGEIISFLDGDDWLLPGKLKAVAETLERHLSVCGVGHGYYEIRDSKNETQIHSVDSDLSVNLQTPAAARQAFYAWYRILNSAFSIRREALERFLPIDDSLTFCADSPISLAGMALGAHILKEPLACYRVHSSNLHASDGGDRVRLRRKYDMMERMFQVIECQLRALQVPEESIAALLYAAWADSSRLRLRTFGGRRTEMFRTEMRSFRSQFANPGLRHRLFKYGVVGAATLSLSPQQFLAARDWYGRRKLGRIRERICGDNAAVSEKI